MRIKIRGACGWKNMRRRRELLLLGLVFLAILIIWIVTSSNKSSDDYQTSAYCSPIDVVYTWVNGSDPAFIDAARHYDPAYDPARFDDKNELRYSLRSLELHAPWVRHIYIVTNGQIPHWLDLSYERVSIVTHELLAPYASQLPTFSSAAIETFLHRIPQLSQKFLYMNDDIFLGAPLYPEDLYTEAEGVRVYQAWLIPDCADDCPWTYIGDGACDRHCNIAECQYDGGDCATGGSPSEEGYGAMVEHDVEQLKKDAPNSQKTLKKNGNRVEMHKFPLRKIYRTLRNTKRNSSATAAAAFKQQLMNNNLTTINEIRSIVDSYNSKLKSQIASFPASTTFKSTMNVSSTSSSYKTTKDIFSQSLIKTNMLLNLHYGFRARNVLAHVGFMLDRNIIAAMQLKFSQEILNTASHRFRASDDLQFAFVYYAFLMGETRTASVEEIFDEFDTDNSTTWSDREIRTFLARVYPLPLDWSAVRFFEEVVSNCSRDLNLINENHHADAVVYSTLVYERYEDSLLPTITRDLVAKCPLLAEGLVANFGIRSKYKYNINPKRAIHSNFMMLKSNVTDVVDALDKLRRNPRKFNCINDNLEPQYVEDNELIRHLLEDFYLSFFPRRSKFELQPLYRNRFSNWQDYQRWRRRKRAVIVVGYGASVVLILFLLRFLCMHKAKFVRRYVQKL